MIQVSAKALLFSTGFLVISIFYYWLHWSSAIPVLGGDHAAYLLMADHFSPFGVHAREVTRAALDYIYSPPFYPLVLGFVGATSANIELAHAVTITFLMAALAWFFMWAKAETRSALQSFLLMSIFALMPTTFFQSFGILSEPLYLWLTLLAVWLLSRTEIPLSRLYFAACVIGLAAITRTAGVALIAAFFVYLLLHKQKSWMRLVLCSLAPIALWNIIKQLSDYKGNYLWILAAIAEGKPLRYFLLDKPMNEIHGLWVGWITSFDHTPVMTSLIVGSFIGAVCLAGAIHRAYLKKFDGIYVIFYLGMLVAWPSTPDARRFLFVVLPILLVQGMLLASYALRRFSSSRPEAFGYIYLFVIVLTIFPPVGLIFNRLAMAAEDSNWKYARSIYWYSGENVSHVLDRNRLQVVAKEKFITSWRKIAEVVDRHECVYSVDPLWLMLYADRPSALPPMASARDQFFREATKCRYVYVASYIHPPYPLFYPRQYLEEGRIVFADRIEHEGREPILGILIEMPGQDPGLKQDV